MKRSENLYYEVVKYNHRTAETLAREVVRKYSRAARLCHLADLKLSPEEKEKGVSWHIRGTTSGPMTLKRKRRIGPPTRSRIRSR